MLVLRGLWAHRRWIYATYLAVAIARIPARTGFHLTWPACDARLTLANASLSLTKIPHIVLFGLFALLTAMQFDRVDRRACGWTVGAAGALGVIVELEEGATRTGNCRLTDVLPDLAGALLATLVLAAAAAAVVRIGHRRETSA